MNDDQNNHKHRLEVIHLKRQRWGLGYLWVNCISEFQITGNLNKKVKKSITK